MLQVFIAGTNTVSIIEHMKNEDGEHQFEVYQSVFIPPENQPFSSAQTYVAKSGGYLVMK